MSFHLSNKVMGRRRSKVSRPDLCRKVEKRFLISLKVLHVKHGLEIGAEGWVRLSPIHGPKPTNAYLRVRQGWVVRLEPCVDTIFASEIRDPARGRDTSSCENEHISCIANHVRDDFDRRDWVSWRRPGGYTGFRVIGRGTAQGSPVGVRRQSTYKRPSGAKRCAQLPSIDLLSIRDLRIAVVSRQH